MKNLFVIVEAVVAAQTNYIATLAAKLTAAPVLNAAVALRAEFIEAFETSGLKTTLAAYEAVSEEVGKAGMVFWSALTEGELPTAKLHSVEEERV